MKKEHFEKNILTKLLKQNVTEVIAGGSNGSIIILKMGNSDYSLLVKCVWRLENASIVLTGWNESNNAEQGNLVKRIKELTGDVIKTIETTKYYDLKIHFESDKILNIFCDVTPMYEPEHYDENWICCDIRSNICYTINNKFKIIESNYS